MNKGDFYIVDVDLEMDLAEGLSLTIKKGSLLCYYQDEIYCEEPIVASRFWFAGTPDDRRLGQADHVFKKAYQTILLEKETLENLTLYKL